MSFKLTSFLHKIAKPKYPRKGKTFADLKVELHDALFEHFTKYLRLSIDFNLPRERVLEETAYHLAEFQLRVWAYILAMYVPYKHTDVLEMLRRTILPDELLNIGATASDVYDFLFEGKPDE